MTAGCVLACLSIALAAEPEALELLDAMPIDHASTHHVQGLSANEHRYFLSSVEKEARCGWLFVIDRRSLKATRALRLALGEQYHPGGMQLANGKLYLPLAEYRPKSTSTILVIDAESGAPERAIPVADHIGAVAVSDNGTIFAANWDAREIRTLDAAGAELGKRANPTGVAYQDMEWHDGGLWCAGQARIEDTLVAVVDVLDDATLDLTQRYLLHGRRRTGGSNFAHEGFTKERNRLLLVPEDGPNSTVYVFEFAGK